MCKYFMINPKMWYNIWCFRVIRGGNGLADGAVSADNLPKVMEKVKAKGFHHVSKVWLIFT